MNKTRLSIICTGLVLVGSLPVAHAGGTNFTEAGCYNIVDTFVGYESVYEHDVVDDGNPLTDDAVYTESKGGGQVQADITLEAASCPEATYVVEIYAADEFNDSKGNRVLLEEYAVQGTGSGTRLLLDTLVDDDRYTTGDATNENDPRHCVSVQLEVRDHRGYAVDVASDNGPISLCRKGDGSGGQTFGS